jgi:hypothetical protein
VLDVAQIACIFLAIFWRFTSYTPAVKAKPLKRGYRMALLRIINCSSVHSLRLLSALTPVPSRSKPAAHFTYSSGKRRFVRCPGIALDVNTYAKRRQMTAFDGAEG